VIPSFKRSVIDKKTLSDAAQNIELSPKKLPVRFVNTSQRSSSLIFLPYHMGTVSVLKTDIKIPFTAKTQSKAPQKRKVKHR